MPDITVTFRLREDVTPDYFANRVAIACMYGYAIKEGESVVLSDGTELSYELLRAGMSEMANLFRVKK